MHEQMKRKTVPSHPPETNGRRGLTIQRRVPALICGLLFFTIVSYTLISFFTARNIALKTGKERLKNLTGQLSSIFGQSAMTLTRASRRLTDSALFISYLSGQKNIPDSSAITALDKLKTDSNWVSAELVDLSGQILLSPDTGATRAIDHTKMVAAWPPNLSRAMIGKLYAVHDSIFYPLVIPLVANGRPQGYVIRWRLQSATPQAIKQFSQLLGTGATLYIGNADSSMWTDLNHPVPPPPASPASRNGFRNYERAGHGTVIGTVEPVAHTPWLLLIEFSRQSILKPASQSLSTLIILGTILLLAGFILAWVLSKRITRPIEKLTQATASVARGDYSQQVELERNDELGQLANTFNSMLVQINQASQIKEEEIQSRTAELNANIARLRESEDRFRSLLEAAPDAMIISDQRGRIVIANKQAEVLFGYSRDELLDQPVEILVPGASRQDHEQHRDSFHHEPKFRGMGVGLELYAVRKNGSHFPVEISLAPLETTGGLLVSAAVRDITQRKEADEEIRELNKELESFTYSVSHDLRSPLRIIDGYADILIEDCQELGEEGKQSLLTIKKNARRMGQLIDDLLNLSHIGRKELSVEPTNMKQLVEEVVEEQLLLGKRPVTVDIGPLHSAKCDASLIRQVWTNLIGNAVKYSSKQDNPVITISSSNSGGQVSYHIKDNGVGFDMKYADKLFGVFQRLHKVTEFEGTGIGLALCKRIVLKHSGRIWAESEPGNGTLISFSLPA